jgi:hypothetical protein
MQQKIGTPKAKVVQKNVNTHMDMRICTRGQVERDKLPPSTNTWIITKRVNVSCYDIIQFDLSRSKSRFMQARSTQLCMGLVQK